jgi:hypothetical protein
MAVKNIQTIVSDCVDALEKSPYRMFIAERLVPIRQCLVQTLIPKIMASKDDGFRSIACIFLLPVEPDFAVPILFELFDRDLDVCLIANAVSVHGVESAVPILLHRLQSCTIRNLTENRNEMDIAICLVHAVRRLEAQIPGEVVTSFSQPNIPWQLRALFVPRK